MTKSRSMAAYYTGAADRLKMIGDALREQADREAAERAIVYCRARVAGRRESFKAEAEIHAIAERHVA
jgi:hypothetical protein